MSSTGAGSGDEWPASWGPAPADRPAGPVVVAGPIAGLGRLVAVLLAVAVAVDVLGVVTSFQLVDVIGRIIVDPDAVTDIEIDRADNRYVAVGFVQIAAMLVAGVPFLIWFRRAYDNAAARLTYHLRHSRGWAIGAWFVPFLNLVRPKQIMDDIWRASRADRREEPRVSGYVHLWWAALVTSWVFNRIFARVANDGTAQGIRSATVMGLVADLLSVAAGVFAIVVVVRLTRLQQGWLTEEPGPAGDGA